MKLKAVWVFLPKQLFYLKMIKQIFYKFANIGIDETMSPSEKKVIGLINRYSVLMIIVMTLSVIVSATGAKWIVVFVDVLSIVSGIVFLWLHSKKKIKLSKHLFVSNVILINLLASFMFEDLSASLVYYIFPVALPVFIFNKKRIYWIYYFIVILSFCITLYYYQNFEPFMPADSIDELKWVHYSNVFIVVFVMMYAIVRFFSSLNGEYEDVLLKKQQLLEERNFEISTQKDIIEESHKKISKSINYASKIQTAAMPTDEEFCKLFPENFILYKPRDVVSGDFYWVREIDNLKIIAVADCSGHGVPGAFVSMLGISFLNEIVRKKEDLTAGKILDKLRIKIKTSLKQTHDFESSKDGMDIALLILDTEKNEAQFAGANNPLIRIKNNELSIVKPTKNPIGIYIVEKDFTNNVFNYSENEYFYMFSDGFSVQIGGEKNQKYMSRRFREFILKNHKLEMQKQLHIFNEEIENWRGKNEQLDDILVVGIKY